ncbi:MAG: hypothetical protein U9N46_04895, partial [Euryarchaeota archaeon]|nr:hypothetical protein [Euryarchaeota archaeon]
LFSTKHPGSKSSDQNPCKSPITQTVHPDLRTNEDNDSELFSMMAKSPKQLYITITNIQTMRDYEV